MKKLKSHRTVLCIVFVVVVCGPVTVGSTSTTLTPTASTTTPPTGSSTTTTPTTLSTGTTTPPPTGSTTTPTTGSTTTPPTGSTTTPPTGSTTTPPTGSTTTPPTGSTTTPPTGSTAIPPTGSTTTPPTGSTTTPPTGSTTTPPIGSTTTPPTGSTTTPPTGSTTQFTGSTTTPPTGSTTQLTTVPTSISNPPTTTVPRVTTTPDPLLPTLTVEKTGVRLKETEQASQPELMKISCATKNGNPHSNVDLVKVEPSFPCGLCFSVLPCNAGFCLMYSAGQGKLNAQVVPRYQVTYSCIDSDNRYVTTTADVFIEPNAPPYFDSATYPGLKVEGEIGQDQGVTVTATDAENDALTYTMVTEPSTDALEIDSLSGEIRVKSGRTLKSECRNHYSATVYAKDSHHTQRAGPIAVALDVAKADQNQRPAITNLKGELRVREDEAMESVLLSMGLVDEDTDVKASDLIFTMNTQPSSAASLFKLAPSKDNKALELQVESPLDYETGPKTVTLSITANDGNCDSETYTLVVRVVDVNEPPILEPASQSLTSCEGKVDISPNWDAKDPDKDDEIKFVKIEPNDKGAFAINEKTGLISTTLDYGIDEEDDFRGKDTVVSTVTISDKQGETATAEVTIRFVDCNDNPPVFPQERAKRFEVNDCETTADAVVGNVDNAKDLDSEYNQNNVFFYSGQGAGAKVEPSGAVVLTKAMKAGEVITFPVIATDLGKVPGPLSSAPYYVSITAVACPPPKTTAAPVPVDPNADSDSDTGPGNGGNTGNDGTGNGNARRVINGNALNPLSLPDQALVGPGEDTGKNRKNDFLDDSLGWLIPAVLLGIALLSLLIYFLWRFLWPALKHCFHNLPGLCKNCTQRPPPPRQVKPVKRQPPPPPQPSPPGPAFIYGFWKETYQDDDYGKTFNQPNRQGVPEASRGIERVDTNTYDVDPIIP